jgi:hypothetical protein
MERNVPNDFVSRYELVKHLVGVHDGWRIPFGYTVEDEIINFPAADVAPVRHGRWRKAMGDSGVVRMTCTNCGFYRFPENDIRERMFNYCPNCGAKMDGGQDK